MAPSWLFSGCYCIGVSAGTRGMGMRLLVVEARAAENLDRTFSDATKVRADALTVLVTPLFDSHRRRIVNLAARHRLPAVYSFRPYVDAGGLMSYGPDIADLFRRAAVYVDKILNLKTAKALGLTIPPSLLQRADQVIE